LAGKIPSKQQNLVAEKPLKVKKKERGQATFFPFLGLPLGLTVDSNPSSLHGKFGVKSQFSQ
jgi:hypothetical protein